MYYDLSGQEIRRRKINEQTIEKYSDSLKDGSLQQIYGSQFSEFNEVKQYCLIGSAFWSQKGYETYMEKLIIGHSSLKEFHTFLSFEFICELIHHKENMSKKTVEVLEIYLLDNIDINCSDSWDFIGVNDNTPAMILAALILTGEYFGMERCIEIGEKRLDDLLDLLLRREFISEYSSPSYSPITLQAIAAVAGLSNRCREKALLAESLLWQQFFKTVYLPVSNMTGPFSRAYAADKQCIDNNARNMLYILLGDKIFINRAEAESAFMASFTYHCPSDIVNSFLNRKYPFAITGTAEISSSADRFLLEPIKGDSKGDYPIRKANLMRNDNLSGLCIDECFEYPCGVSDLSVFMTQNYALGTCSRDWHSGVQADGFTLCYTKNDAPALTQAEIGSVYANYCLNCDTSFVRDCGRKFSFQNSGHSMTLYNPASDATAVTQAKLSLYFSNYKNLFKALVAGEEKIELADLDKRVISIPLGNIYIYTGSIYIHLLPLINENLSNTAFAEISAAEEHLIISFYNYKGDTKYFRKKELRAISNGFICNVECSSALSFDDFCGKYSGETVTDRTICNVHTRYTMMREVKYQCGSINLQCCISPISNGIKYMTSKIQGLR